MMRWFTDKRTESRLPGMKRWNTVKATDIPYVMTMYGIPSP